MDLAKYVVNKISDAVTSPYAVKQCSSLEYKASILVQHEANLSLYYHNNAYDCVLVNPYVQHYDFKLFRIQVTQKSEALSLFSTFYQILPALLTEETKSCYEVTKLNILCTVIRNNPSWSVAHIVVKSGISDLLQKDILVDFIDSQCCTKHMSPLHLACDLKRFDILKKLAEIAVRFDLQDDCGETVYHYVVKNCSLDFMKFLCKNVSHKEAFNMVNAVEESPLHIACKLNKLEHVICLLEAGANVQLCSKIGLPIHYALKHSTTTDICSALLVKDPSLAGKLCRLHRATPMHWCRTHEHVHLLKKYSPNMNIQSTDGHTPLHVMVVKNRLCAAIAMILCGTDINSRGRHNNTALHLAAQTDDVELVKMLILFGADCNAANDFGETPGLLFMRSAKPNKEKMIEMMSSVGGIVLENFPTLGKTGSQQRLLDNLYNSAAAKPSESDDIIIISDDDIEKPMGSSKKCKVLCLDGGGIRGLVLTQILIAIERETGKQIRDLFDWIAGTSTGAILALALMTGKSAVDCQRIYFNLKDKVFSGSRPYGPGPMEEFLKEEFGENTQMLDISGGKTKVVITATLLDQNPGRLFLFRNYRPPYEEKDYLKSIKVSELTGKTKKDGRLISPMEVPLWQVARSSGAAPTYFPPVGKFVDGGLLSNNPTLDILSEIHKCNKALRANVDTKHEAVDVGLVVSVGTGIPPIIPIKSLDIQASSNPLTLVNSAMTSLKLLNVMVDVTCECNEHVEDRCRSWCESLDIPYFRLSPTIESDVLLNETDDAKLIDLMWETKLYLFKKQHNLKEIIHFLK